MSGVVYYTVLGQSIATLRARITATAVALLMAYVVNWTCHGLATYVLYRNEEKSPQKNAALAKLLQTTRVMYLYAVCIIFSVYPPFFQGLAPTIISWIVWLFVLLMHVFCFMDLRIIQRSLWAYMYALYHFSLIVWFLLIMGFAYTWMSWFYFILIGNLYFIELFFFTNQVSLLLNERALHYFSTVINMLQNVINEIQRQFFSLQNVQNCEFIRFGKMISIQIQQWQQMKAKMAKLEQQVIFLRNQNQQLKNKLNHHNSQQVNQQISQSSGNVSISEQIKQKYSHIDSIKQIKHMDYLSPLIHNGKYQSLNMDNNLSLNAYYPDNKSIENKSIENKLSDNKSIENQSNNKSIDKQSFEIQQPSQRQDKDSITVSRKSFKQIELKNIISSKKSSQHQLKQQLHLIQQICVFGPSLSSQVLHNVTFKIDQKQLVQPSLYYPKDSLQYQHYGSYLFPKKCRIKPTQKSHVAMQCNKIIFKSPKRQDYNIFIFQGNQKHPIKQSHEMFENVNPSKWLYGIVIEFSDFVFQQYVQQKKSSQQQLNQVQSPLINRQKRGSLLQIDIKGILQQQIRMQTVSLKDIELQNQKQRMYRSSFSLCIFTYFPFVNYFQSIITTIFNQVKLKRIQNFSQTNQSKSCDIFYFIKEINHIATKVKTYFMERPVKMGKQLSLKINNQTQISIDLSKQYLYKQLYCNWSYKIFKLFDKQSLYQIYCMIMLQQSVTFICQDKKLLTFIILFFSSMLTKPFIYPYPVVSVLFSQELLQTPFTSIVGINQSQSWLQQAIENRIIDSDNKQIVIITQKQVKIIKNTNFNAPKSQRLKRIFTKFYKKTQPSSLSTLLLRRDSLPMNQTVKQTNEYVVNFFAKLQIFYHENIFAFMPSKMKIQKKSEQQGQVNKVTIRNQFLNEIQKQYKRANPNYLKDEFIRQFIKSQIFNIYLMNEYQLQS